MVKSARCWLPLMLCLSLPAQTAPQRIVSLTPHLTELIYEIGAGDKLVAVDDASDRPAQVVNKPKVANYRSVNLEALLAQKPDLILAWRPAQARMVAPLAKLGIPIFYSEPSDFASIASELRALGRLLDLNEQAELAANRYLTRLSQIKARYQHNQPVRAFYQLWYPPLTSASQLAWPAQAIELCGGINVMADAKIPYPQVNLEQVIKRDPAVILVGSQDIGAMAHWQQWPMLKAVKQQQIYLVDAHALHRFTPRALDAVEQICQHLAKAATALP